MKNELIFAHTARESGDPTSLLQELHKHARVWWKRVAGAGRRSDRRLRIREMLKMGDRGFVAVVEFEQCRFLLGGTPASIVLLSKLESNVDAIAGPHSTTTQPAGEQ